MVSQTVEQSPELPAFRCARNSWTGSAKDCAGPEPRRLSGERARPAAGSCGVRPVPGRPET